MRNQTKERPPLKLVTVRMPPEIHQEIARLANEQRRSIHGQIMWAIERHVEREAEKAAA